MNEELWDTLFIDTKTGKTVWSRGTRAAINERIHKDKWIAIKQTLAVDGRGVGWGAWSQPPPRQHPPSKTVTEMLSYARRVREAPAYLGGSFEFKMLWPSESPTIEEVKPKPTGEVKTYKFREVRGEVVQIP